MAQRKRTSSFDAIKQREVCAIVAVGGSRQTAARYVGCSVATIRRAAANDEHFAEALEQAETQAEVSHLTNIRQSAPRSWRASAWLLERLRPDVYGKRRAHTYTVEELCVRVADWLFDSAVDASQRELLLQSLDRLVEASRCANDEAPP